MFLMRVVKIRKINPISAFKVGFGIGTVVGAIAAVIYILMSFIGGIADKGIFGGLGTGFLGIFIGIFVGLIYVLSTALTCWLGSIIYNIVVRFVGELEIEVSSM